MKPNAVRIDGQTAYVAVACKKRGFMGEALVDVADLERVRRLRWGAAWDAKSQTYYVRTAAHWKDDDGQWRTTTLTLHRLVMNAPSRLKVDHRNHDGLDNRRENLRLTTHAQNLQNRKGARRESSSGVRGVSWDTAHGKWKAGVKVDGHQIYLGRYTVLADAEAAAIAGRQMYMTHSGECEQPGIQLS